MNSTHCVSVHFHHVPSLAKPVHTLHLPPYTPTRFHLPPTYNNIPSSVYFCPHINPLTQTYLNSLPLASICPTSCQFPRLATTFIHWLPLTSNYPDLHPFAHTCIHIPHLLPPTLTCIHFPSLAPTYTHLHPLALSWKNMHTITQKCIQ